MIKLVGTYVGTDEETVTPRSGGDPFTKHTVKVRNGEGRTYFAQTANGFGLDTLPAVGQPVELLVWPRPYVSKSTDSLGCGWTVYAVAPALASV